MIRASAFLLLLLTTSAQSAEVTRVQHLMGALCEIQAVSVSSASAQLAVTAAFNEISRLENILSTYRPESETSHFIQAGHINPHTCSDDLFSMLSISLDYSKQTNGAFDITLARNGYASIELGGFGKTAKLNKPGMKIDFGGIGKGYALDKAIDTLKRNGVTQALLNFSGNIALFGPIDQIKPLVVADPISPEKTVLTIGLSNGSVSTSSQLERKNHIIDPQTGHPVNFQGSVTVISPTATEADALSTALLVMGPEKGLKLLETKFSKSAALYLIPSDGRWTHIMSPNFNQFIRKKQEDINSEKTTDSRAICQRMAKHQPACRRTKRHRMETRNGAKN